MFALILMLLFADKLFCHNIQEGAKCDTPQYQELEKTGIIRCTFPVKYIGIIWYNTTDYLNHDPILHFRNFRKTGYGYESGDYDVLPDGSLIVKTVSFGHERTFRVAVVHSEDSGAVFTDVEIIVFVKPIPAFPTFSYCGNMSRACFCKMHTPHVKCSVSKTRPRVGLVLMVRTIAGDKNVSRDLSTISSEVDYTSHIYTTVMFKQSPLLSLLICKAFSPPGMLEYNESLLLAQNGDIDLSAVETTSIFLEDNSRLQLSCTKDVFSFIVWKKVTLGPHGDSEAEILGYSVLLGEKVTETYSSDTIMEGDGLLVLSHVHLKDNGFYYCVCGDGITDDVTGYNVSVIVYPVPPHPVIEGCKEYQFCVLQVKREGSMMCSIKGIHPHVQLEWKTHFLSERLITFANEQQTVENKDGTFDVTLISTYSLIDVSRQQLTIQCQIVQSHQTFFDLKASVDLYFEKAQDPIKAAGLQHTFEIVISAIIGMFMITLVPLIVWISCVKQRKSQVQKKTEDVEEQSPMVAVTDNFKEVDEEELNRKTQVFKDELKTRYEDLYNAVQPIPYIRDRLYCVDKVFVEGGIQLMTHCDGKDERWESLRTYADIFTDQRVNFNRIILEGEPGYGKSTVALQIVYDWCNNKDILKLKDAKIVILLRLRQLGDVPSVFAAIRNFLLPCDSKLTERDIQKIMTSSKSNVIILDGYDEYPDQDTSSDVMKIIKRDMFQQSQVILTTRSSYLPTQYAPRTIRIRLTGFDEVAQDTYIRKAVMCKETEGKDKNEKIEKIKLQIKGNLVLSGLCEVPLFFVMLAHMMHESKIELYFNSVTGFFKHMIACFYEHMKLKMTAENSKTYELFETDHGKLDEVAFEGLCKKSKSIVWVKEDLVKRLGKPFYDAYIRIGILVEENLERFVNKTGTDVIDRKTEVTFHHKLFCEWYAAHFLSKYASKRFPMKLKSMVKKMDPFDLQYVYRFACGINLHAADKIINSLCKLEGGDKFAVLCIMEQPEKVDQIKETIRDLCSEGVIISGHDSKLLQWSYIQLLEIAAKENITVDMLELHNCLVSVDPSQEAINITSNLTLSSKIPITQLRISLYNRVITEHEVDLVLKFSSNCRSLKILWFVGSVPPRYLQNDCMPTLSQLKSNGVAVKYWGVFMESPECILNLDTGRWETEESRSQCTDEDFKKMNADWDKVRSYNKDYSEDVKNYRQHLSDEAKKKRQQSNTRK